MILQNDLQVLCYHVISDSSLGHIENLYPYKTRRMFEADLIYLKESFNLISYEQFVNASRSEGKIMPNSLILSFDDGYAQCYSVVRPLLLKHKVPCIFFITTDLTDNKKMFFRNKVSLCIHKVKTIAASELTEAFCKINSAFGQNIDGQSSFIYWIKSLRSPGIIDNLCTILEIDTDQYLSKYKPYLTSGQIKTLSSEGFKIGAHSKSHPYFDLLSEGKIEQEIVGSCRTIMDLTGEDDIPFSFPFSGFGVHRPLLKSLISRYKFIGLFFDINGSGAEDSFIIKRICCDSPPSIAKKV